MKQSDGCEIQAVLPAARALLINVKRIDQMYQNVRLQLDVYISCGRAGPHKVGTYTGWLIYGDNCEDGFDLQHFEPQPGRRIDLDNHEIRAACKMWVDEVEARRCQTVGQRRESSSRVSTRQAK